MTDEWRDPDDIAEDLASGEAERIRVGIAGLREFTKAGDEVDLPAVEPWVLRPFGEAPPEQTVIDLARLLGGYRSFVPEPSRRHVVRQLVELAVRYGVSQVVYETSIEIQGQADPPAAARDAVGYLRMRGLSGAREIRAAEMLIAYLLEAKVPVRRAATEALAAWPDTELRRALVAAVLPLADPDQRPLLDGPPVGEPRPPMRFETVAVNREEWYSLGVERHSGRCYVSIPVTNGFVDYQEYYEISPQMLAGFRADPASACPFVARCRDHDEDPRLFYQPSIRRGSAT